LSVYLFLFNGLIVNYLYCGTLLIFAFYVCQSKIRMKYAPILYIKDILSLRIILPCWFFWEYRLNDLLLSSFRLELFV